MTATMSRWTDDDFIAWIIGLAKENGWKYRVLDFPAIAVCRVPECKAPAMKFVRDEKTLTTKAELQVCGHGVRDDLGRLPGEALWPKVRPISFLLRQLVDGGSKYFLALFQGRPQRAETVSPKRIFRQRNTCSSSTVTSVRRDKCSA
jgi:hypothetical protein